MTCPICTCETDALHDDEQCAEALIESGLFSQTPWFNQAIPPADRWTDQQRQFATELSLQAILWKKAELEK